MPKAQPRAPKTVSASPPRDPASFDAIAKAAAAAQAEADRAVRLYANPFVPVANRGTSEFALEFPVASYKTVRAALQDGKFPPPKSVRTEQIINQFTYAYAAPADDGAPISASVEIATCPWDVNHRLARIALRAADGPAGAVVARGVTASVKFDPQGATAWRLIGYETGLAYAGLPIPPADLTAGTCVTAFYEIVPTSNDPRGLAGKTLFTLAVGYQASPVPAKRADAVRTFPVVAIDAGNGFDRASEDFRFASAAAAFAMILRDSPHKGTATYPDVMRWATAGKGADPTGERAAFIELARQARDLSR
jgi:hypothetical protein